MPKNRIYWAVLAVLAVGCAIALGWLGKKSRDAVLNIAVIDSLASDNLLRQLADPKALPPGLPKGLKVQVFPLDYQHLYEALQKLPKPDSGEKSPYDVVMLDDPWLAELAENGQVEQVPVGRPEDIALLTIGRFAPEFLWVCYYHRWGKDKPLLTARRPKLDDVKEKESVVQMQCGGRNQMQCGGRNAGIDLDRGKYNVKYDLYALPYLGNVQVLAVHGANGKANTELDKLLKPDATLGWKGLQDALSKDKAHFLSRLFTNNSAVTDFLPILWSKGGCLVGWNGENEVSGLTGDPKKPFTLTTEAFRSSIDLAGDSPPQYTRFNDEDVFQSLSLSKEPSVGISWLTFRYVAASPDYPKAEKIYDKIRWYSMPGGTEAKGPCEEGAKAGHNRPGDSAVGVLGDDSVLGVWLLAVPTGAVNPTGGWAFIKWALAQLDQLKGESCSATASTKRDDPKRSHLLGEAKPEYGYGYPTPFRDKLSCDLVNVIEHSAPRAAHPRWHDIEDAVGFRLRQAHWRTLEPDCAAKLASADVQKILDRNPELPPDPPADKSQICDSQSNTTQRQGSPGKGKAP